MLKMTNVTALIRKSSTLVHNKRRMMKAPKRSVRSRFPVGAAGPAAAATGPDAQIRSVLT
jgi:hypothetical protein